MEASLCKCGHTYAAHTKDIREADVRRTDGWWPGGGNHYNPYTDRDRLESGCTECECIQCEPRMSI
jgi:hypothetical protein